MSNEAPKWSVTGYGLYHESDVPDEILEIPDEAIPLALIDDYSSVWLDGPNKGKPMSGMFFKSLIYAVSVREEAPVRQALCGVCHEPVPFAYYDTDGKIQAVGNNVICTEGNVAYHYTPEKDCYGKHTGYPNFEKMKK
jgi:hypothetical protein